MRGARLTRPRALSREVLVFDLRKSEQLWLDFSAERGGLYLLAREETAACGRLLEPGAEGTGKQTLLHLRKHVDGERVGNIARVPGTLTVVLETGRSSLVLEFGTRGSLTLFREGERLGSFGPGEPQEAPLARPDLDWSGTSRALHALRAEGQALSKHAIREACPVLGPHLVEWLLSGPADELQEMLEDPKPALVTPKPLSACHDEDLVPSTALGILPVALAIAGRLTTPTDSFKEAASLFLVARLRSMAFVSWKQKAVSTAKRVAKRHATLAEHLAGDLGKLSPPADLRRLGEALLASPGDITRGAQEILIPDPYDPEGAPLRVPVNPMLSRPQNADRLFEKARRAEGALVRITARRDRVLAELRDAVAELERLGEAKDLPATGVKPSTARKPPSQAKGPLVFLTSRGLSLRIGRGAKENHALTFSIAKPEDFWLHARDVPGAHVILEDREGRANAEDLREAAEAAAFMSDARAEARVDVHVIRRKHVRPAPGGAGRVRFTHSETLRVVPKDPQGRLRARPR